MLTVPEPNPGVYCDDRIWQAYQHSLSCPTDAELAVAMGIPDSKLQAWKAEHGAFYRAIQAARAKVSAGKGALSALTNHIENNLPPDLKELWDQLQKDVPDNPARMALATKGQYDRQRLFLHALSATQFDLSRCMKLCNISQATLDNWAKTDPRFVKLWQEVVASKKAFVESALMGLIAGGNTRAILFASERLNKEEYGPPTQKIEGTVTHNHNVAILDLSKLDLDVDTRMRVLDAVKRQGLLDDEGLLLTDPLRPKIIDATSVESR